MWISDVVEVLNGGRMSVVTLQAAQVDFNYAVMLEASIMPRNMLAWSTQVYTL